MFSRLTSYIVIVIAGIMRPQRAAWLCLLACLIAIAIDRPAWAQQNTAPIQLAAGPGAPGTLVRVTTNCPIFVLPDSNREPLRIAKEGSVLTMIRTEGDFTYVEFSDPDYPRRYGYIQSRFVVQAVARTPIDLSVPEARQLAAPAGQVTRPSLPPPDQQVVRPRPPDTPDTSSGGGKSSASRFFVGVRFEGNGIVTDPSGGNVTSSGSGGGIVLGYGFTPHWALYGEISDAVLDDGVTNLAHVDIGTRIHFLAGPHKAVPFVQFGISGRAEAATLGGNTVTVSGAGIAFGAGVNIHFVPSFAFSTGVAWSAGDFNKLAINGRDLSGGGSVTAVSARVHVGVIWFPGAHAS